MSNTGGAANNNRVEQTFVIVTPKELQTNYSGHLENTGRSKSCCCELENNLPRW